MPSATTAQSAGFLDGHPRYSFVRELSSGAFGIVALCENVKTDEFVAIKFMERGVSMSKYVELEVLNHRWLKHEHIVQFKELFLTPSHICIVMEYANGGNLYNKLISSPHGRLDETSARWYFQQLIIALDYCHRPGAAKPAIFNRDIKLENILLAESKLRLPYVKLCDFGYSKNDRVSRPKSKVGTLVYMAPEVVQGGKYEGSKADIWSCGVTLYVLLVGRYPFDASRDRGQDKQQYKQEVSSLILNSSVKVPDEVASTLSPDCLDMMAKLLQSDPARRIDMAAIQSHPWFLSHLPGGVLEYNDRCLAIVDYGDMQSEDSIKEMLIKHNDESLAEYEDVHSDDSDKCSGSTAPLQFLSVQPAPPAGR